MTEPTMDATRAIASIHPTRGVGWRRQWGGRGWWATGFVAFLALTGVAAPAAAQASAADEAGVRRAALDYLEGFYEGDDAKLRRGIHPEVNKFGFARRGGGGEYQHVPMSFAQMFEFAASVRAGRNLPPEGAPKDVILLDVQDQTAVVKVLAWWGQDYLHMARYDGAWKIVHVLWQSLDS